MDDDGVEEEVIFKDVFEKDGFSEVDVVVVELFFLEGDGEDFEGVILGIVFLGYLGLVNGLVLDGDMYFSMGSESDFSFW